MTSANNERSFITINPGDVVEGILRRYELVKNIKVYCNIVHGSDSEKSTHRETNLWFRSEEISQRSHTAERWIYERK